MAKAIEDNRPHRSTDSIDGLGIVLKSLCRACGIDLRRLYHYLSAKSLEAAIRQQGLSAMVRSLRIAAPDVADQLTNMPAAVEFERFWELKLRGLHAFQVSCTLEAMDYLPHRPVNLVDIGDSSGNHARYLRALAPAGGIGRIVSINSDPVAIEKIRAKGVAEAVHGRIEDIDPATLAADLCLSFETLEHLTDPVRFLHALAAEGPSAYLLITVPYRRDSRFGDDNLRLPKDRMPSSFTAESLHMFELKPEDWRYLCRLAGWRVRFQRLYLQYPRWSLLSLTRDLWRRLDFEGFLGLFLERDLSLSNRYRDW